MTERSPARPFPGPTRPGPAPAGGRPTPAEGPPRTAGHEQARSASFDDLEQLPVTEHVGVFEAEHTRLQGELGTIDQV